MAKRTSNAVKKKEKIDLSQLNEAQKAAVTHTGGPLLVIAGAGTGKTAVITQRIAWLIQEKGIRPDNILALTFTEKAAAEMEERVDRLLPLGYSQVRIATFHGYCERLLRDYAIEIGLDPNFRILTVPEQWLLLRKHLFELPIKYFRPLGNPTKFLQAIIRAIGAAKDQDLGPEKFAAYAESLEQKAKDEVDEKEKAALSEEAMRWNEFAEVYRAYREIMIQESAMDFGDIILNAVRLLKERASILKQVQGNLSEVLVDEFQDTNGAQNSLLRLLVPDNDGPITVVGDDDQSIYAWRGSNITNILTFQQWYPKAKKIVLTQNYRSPQGLLDAAYKLIQFNNPLRLEKTANVDKRLKSSFEAEGVTVSHHHFSNIERECQFIADTIRHGVDKLGRQYSDYAILLRTNSQSDLIVPALIQKDIMFHVAEARGLLLRSEVRDIAAYLRVVLDPQNSISLFRVLSLKVFGIEPYERQQLFAESRKNNIPLINLLRNADASSISEETKAACKKIIALLDNHVFGAMSVPPSKIALEFLQGSGYLDFAIKKAEELPELLPNLSEFVRFIRDYERSDPDSTLLSFLDYLDLVVSSGESPAQASIGTDYDAVRLMTVHGAKGLEFPIVFLFGTTSDKYPVRDRSDLLEIPDIFSSQQEVDPRDAHILEERRLFYVAMTRARERLYITSAILSGTGKSKKKPSKFIEEAGVETLSASESGSFMEQLRLPMPKERIIPKRAQPLYVPKQISASQVETYETCPLKYKFNYVYKIPVPQHHSLTFGIAVHAVLREIARMAKAGTPATLDNAFSFYDKFWSSEGFETKQHEEDQKKRGREQLKTYLESHPELLEFAPLYSEEPFRFRLGDVTINGRIDRVDRQGEQVTVIDFKTGSAKDQKYADDDLQLSVYAIALQEVFKLHADRLVLSYLDGPVDRRTTRTEKDLAETKERLLESIQGIQAQNFTSKAGPMSCQFCPFRTICDESSV